RYDHLRDIACLASLNPSPEHWKFLREVVEMTDDEIRRAHAYLPAYQLVGRTSIRRSDSQERCDIIVPDMGCANFLAEQFPGIEVARLENIELTRPSERSVGRPRSENPSAAALRKRRWRESKRAREMN